MLHDRRCGTAGSRIDHESNERPKPGGEAKIAGFFTTPPEENDPTLPAKATLPGTSTSPCAPFQTSNGMFARLLPRDTGVPGCVKTVKCPGTGRFETIPDKPFNASDPLPATPVLHRKSMLPLSPVAHPTPA